MLKPNACPGMYYVMKLISPIQLYPKIGGIINARMQSLVYSSVLLRIRVSRLLQTLAVRREKLTMKRGAFYRNAKDGADEVLQLVFPQKFRNVALTTAHTDMGHFGRERMLHVLRDSVYWPNMTSDVQSWIRSCEHCIRRKTPTYARAPLVNIQTSQPMELVCMDCLSLELSKGGYQNILVISDHFTKFAMAVPANNQTAKTTAEALFNGFILHYGLPLRLHSDQGAHFQGSVIQELCKLTGIQKSLTTPYHAMGNGLVKYFNKTLLNMMGTLEPSKKTN